ncbi:MAG: fibronectin type III domain-containing protein [Lepagella sp.]
MKKLLLTTLLVGAAMTTASAKEYVVYNGGQDLTADQTQLPVNFYTWEGTVNTVDNTDEFSKDFTINNDVWWGAGWEIDGTNFDITTFAQSETGWLLKFEVKSDAANDALPFQLQFSSTGATTAQPDIDIPCTGQWEEVSLNIKDTFNDFLSGVISGNNMYCFAPVGGSGWAGKSISFRNIRLVEISASPIITLEATNITETTADLAYSISLPSALTGADVAVYYKEKSAADYTLASGSPIALTDLLEKTNYTYVVKAVATLSGVEYVSEKEVSFMTGGLYKSGNKFYGNVEKDGFTYNYILIAENDGSLTCKADVIAPEGTEDVVRQIKIADNWITFSENTDATTVDAYPYTANGTGSFTLGEWSGDLFFYVPYAGGAARYDITDYLYGLANEAPAPAPSITVSADEITATTATLSYSVTTPSELSGATVAVYYKEASAESFTLLENSPLVLSDLTPNTSYTYQFKAVATLDDVEYESKVKDVTFTTLRDGAVALSWYAIVDGKIVNAYLIGEDAATMRRDIPVSIETKVTYNVDQTITVEATPHGDVSKIVGMVPKITISSSDYKFEYKDMSVADGKWNITTDTTYPDSHGIGWLYFFLAYDGGASSINVNGYTTGAENEAPSYGELGSINLELSKSELKVGDKAIVTAYGVDNNWHYLLGDDNAITLSMDSEAFTLDGINITATDKGVGTIKATCGDAYVDKGLVCFESTDCKTMTASDSGFTYTATNYNESDTQDLSAAFDGNIGTQVEWSCGETQEHGVVVEFEKNMVVEAIRLVWEGASAKKYTVTLYADFADADNQVLREVKAYETLAVEDGEGGAGVTAYKNFYKEDFTPYIAKKIVLATETAWEAGWGIKLKEMAIDGTGEYSGILSGVENVISDKATTGDIYNMQGICVKRAATTEDLNTLPAGIYIINGKKIVVK